MRSIKVDGVQLGAVALQPGFRFVHVRAEALAQRPEFRTVVHLAQMRNLMGGQIINDVFRCHDNPPGEAEISFIGT